MLQLYSPRPIVRKSFKGAKSTVVPNQSMSLRTIIQKYVRHEPMDVNSQEGFYEENLGDLEKLAHQDMFDLHEMYKANKLKLQEMEKKSKNEAEAKKKAEYDEMINLEVQKRIELQLNSQKSKGQQPEN